MPTTDLLIEDMLLSSEYVESPYAFYDILRDEQPIYWSRKWNAWVLTRYDDALAVLQDFKSFSNMGRYGKYLSTLPSHERTQLAYLEHHYQHGGLVQADPPAHNRLRKLISKAFTPRTITQMDGLVRLIVAELIDEFVNQEEVELINSFAFPLPAIVIAGVLGVPVEERNRFKDWSSTIQRFLGSGKCNFSYALAAQESWRHMNEYFAQLLTQRRENPQQDLVSSLAHASENGECLTEDEIIRTCGAMLIAGHETTTNLISNGVWRLLDSPEQKALLTSDTTLYPSAIEEILRLETPFQSVPRTLTTDVKMRGHTLRKGQLAHVMLGAANRDPLQFDKPDRFDIRRTDNKHIAFGYGIHFCLGAALARLEGPIAIQAILERFPQMTLQPNRPPKWKTSMVQRGMEEFWLTLN